MSKYATVSLCALLVMLSTGCALAQAGRNDDLSDGKRLVTPLLDFESQKEVDTYAIRKTNPRTVFELSSEHATSGKYCVKFVAPKDPKSPWPAVFIKQLPEREFGLYKHIVVDVFNPMDKKIPVDLYFNLANGENIAFYASNYAEPGQNTLRIRTGPKFLRSPVKQMQFYQDRPSETRTMYIDNVKLVSEDFDVLLQDARDAFSHCQQRLTEVEEFPHLHKRLRRLENALELHAKQLRLKGMNKRQWLKQMKSYEPQLDKLYQDYVQAVAGQNEKRFDQTLGDRTWGYVWTNGMAKVARNGERPFTWQEGTLRVEMARNEYEGCQIVLRSKKNLKNVTVSLSDLVASDGSVLKASQVQVLPVGYVDTAKASPVLYKVDYRGWHPDPLLDFLSSFELNANTWQPVWLDVHATVDQKPGVYRGTVTVTADGAAMIEAPIEVEVWNARISKEQHLPVLASLDAWRNDLKVYDKSGKARGQVMRYKQGAISSDKLTGEARKLYELEKGFQDELLKHRLNPSSIYTWYPERIDEQKRWLDAGANMFNIIYIPSMDHLPIGVGDPCPPWFKKKYLGVVRKRVAELKAAGMLKYAYIYCFDEIKQRQFAAAREMLTAVKKEFPEIPIVCCAGDSTWGEKSGLADCVDIWIGGIVSFELTLPTIRKTGKKVWPYICNGPFNPYPNWFIEYTGEEQRLMMGLMAFKYDWGGFLYYTLLGWIDTTQKVFDVIDRGPLTNNNGRGWGGAVNGDGFIFYPGVNGIMSSIRAKCIRDGLEDFELLWSLRKTVEGVKQGKVKAPEGWLAKAEQALQVPEGLVKNAREYTRDSQAILAHRRKVGRLLSEIEPVVE